jgi:hypothetical protein
MGTALVAGALTIAGTLLGSGLTTVINRRTVARSGRQTWLEARPGEFRSAVSQFVGALLVYRVPRRSDGRQNGAVTMTKRSQLP